MEHKMKESYFNKIKIFFLVETGIIETFRYKTDEEYE